MTSTNSVPEGGTTDQHDILKPDAAAAPVLAEGVWESRRDRRRRRRADRRAERKARQTRWRTAWVATTVDADLPVSVEDRVPDWARSGRGRVLLAAAAVAALLVWALVFTVIAGSLG